MDEFIKLLRDLIPLWLVLFILGFGYLIYLFRKSSKEFIKLSEKQSEYLKIG